MKVLVTGATGYIGGRLAHRLASREHRIRVLVRHRCPALDEFDCVYGDLLKPESLSPALEDVDVVCHCAGQLGKWQLPDVMFSAVNTEGPKHLLLAAKEAGIEYFLHLSAGGVTGPLGPVPADESTPCHPRTIYERTKLEGEQTVSRLALELDLPTGVARPTFTYGPGDPHKLGLFKAIQKGHYFFIGGGRSTTHPVFIEDLLDGLELMLEQRPRNEVFIIGGSRPVTIRELSETIAESLDVPPPRFSLPSSAAWGAAIVMEKIGQWSGREPPLTRSRVLALSRHWGMDIGKARQMLGYAPKFDLHEGIARTTAWYRRESWL